MRVPPRRTVPLTVRARSDPHEGAILGNAFAGGIDWAAMVAIAATAAATVDVEATTMATATAIGNAEILTPVPYRVRRAPRLVLALREVAFA